MGVRREGEGGRERGEGEGERDRDREITLRVNAVETSQHVRYVHVMLPLQLAPAFPEAE